MTIANEQELDFSWASKQWTDPLTGVDVVRLSPENSEHFRNTYFRVQMISPDARYLVLMSQAEVDKGPAKLSCIDLRNGALRDLGQYDNLDLIYWGMSYQDNTLYVLERVDGFIHIHTLSLDTDERRLLKTELESKGLGGYANASADGRFMYFYWSKLAYERKGPKRSHEISMMGSRPGHNIMYRVDLETGICSNAFECMDWWMGHCNPNPVNPDLFMCCQEGWIWTEEYPRPDNFQRIRVIDFKNDSWLDMTDNATHVCHEMWSANGRRIYGHGTYCGHHSISRFDVASSRWETYVMANKHGWTMHVHRAPNEQFLVGDGHNFGANNRHEVPEEWRNGDKDNPWAYDGINEESPGEIIWKYTLPEETLVEQADSYSSKEQLAQDIVDCPEKAVAVTPICTFRSRMKLIDHPIRLESNAQVTPDNRWVIFQSCSEDAVHEVWAARIP